MVIQSSSVDIRTSGKFFNGLSSSLGINYETIEASQDAIIYVQDISKDYLNYGKTIEDFIEYLNKGVDFLCKGQKKIK